MKYYTTPETTAPRWMFALADQPHVLIGGTTGSGKSVALNGFLRSLMRFTPGEAQLLLIDPKGVELADWDRVPHSIGHFCEVDEIERVIAYMVDVMEGRFRDMKERHLKMFTGPDVYVVIDEYVDIRLNCSKETRQNLVKIACKGRAARIHLIICTQRPTREIIDGSLRACIPCTLALRCSCPQESRNLIDVRGAEALPLHGEALLRIPTDADLVRVTIPMTDDEEIASCIAAWEAQK